MQLKGNPFVSNSPTYKNHYLVELTDNVLRIRVHIKTKDVPYCDCFAIDEEYLCVMPKTGECPEPCRTSSVFRVSMAIQWLKSTMMKSIIASNSVSQSKAVWTAYQADWLKKNGHLFKETKKEKKVIQSKVSHGIEKIVK